MRQLIISSCLVFLFSCQTDTPKTQSDYFDIKGFFKQEAIRLKVSERILDKKLKLGDKVEHIKIDTPDWNKELSAFMEIDLLLPGYNGKFSIDTLTAGDGEFEVLYKRRDDKLPLSEIKLAFDKKHQLKEVAMIMSNQNSLYKSHKELIYYTDSAYRIKGYQDVRLLDGASYEIEANFK